jgi:hypothetical protein
MAEPKEQVVPLLGLQPGETEDDGTVRAVLESKILTLALRLAVVAHDALKRGKKLPQEIVDLCVLGMALGLHHRNIKERLREGGAAIAAEILARPKPDGESSGGA